MQPRVDRIGTMFHALKINLLEEEDFLGRNRKDEVSTAPLCILNRRDFLIRVVEGGHARNLDLERI
jgi:hypothetical protein